MQKNWSAVKLARWTILAVPPVVLAWLASQYFSVFGELAFAYDFGSESPYVSEFTPAGRALDRAKNLRTGETSQMIVGDPVYLAVNVPRSFNEVTVTAEYQNPEQPLLEFGLVTSTEPWSVRLNPFESKVIDQALAEWHRVDGTGVTLLQREPTFATVDEFLAALPLADRVGSYRYTPPNLYRDPGYVAEPGGLELNHVLRGPHEFVTYAANESLHFGLDLIDSNREFNADPVKVEVYRDSVLVHEELLPDDGIVDATGQPSAPQSLSIDLPVSDAGLYRVVLAVNDDIFLTHLATDQDRLVIPRRLYLAQSAEYASVVPGLNTIESQLWLHGEKLTAKTDHPAGLQTVSIGDDTLLIDRVSSPHLWEEADPVSPLLRPLTVPNNDLLLATPGWFALSEESAFDPSLGITPLDETTALDELDLIVFSDYTPPVPGLGSTVQTASFSLDGVAGDRKDLQFVLSAPGLDRANRSLEMTHLEFRFQREPLLTRLKQRFLP
jgi:hypothetical protein